MTGTKTVTRNSVRPARLLLAAVTATLIAGCTLGPAYERPAAELPAAYQGKPEKGLSAVGDRWWTLYSDQGLNLLVDEALAHNQDLALAVARVDEARALSRVSDSLMWPSVD